MKVATQLTRKLNQAGFYGFQIAAAKKWLRSAISDKRRSRRYCREVFGVKM